jgi:hypothetical protein
MRWGRYKFSLEGKILKGGGTLSYAYLILSGVPYSYEPVEKVQFPYFFKFAFNNIKWLEIAELPFWGFPTGSIEVFIKN